jgi:hypothetical protein
MMINWPDAISSGCQVETEVGKPRVNFREKITKRVDFDYLHKKQSGGQGQYGRVIGFIEPMTEEELEALVGTKEEKFEFVNGCIGNNIPPGFITSIERVRAQGELQEEGVGGCRGCVVVMGRRGGCGAARPPPSSRNAEFRDPSLRISTREGLARSMGTPFIAL